MKPSVTGPLLPYWVAPCAGAWIETKCDRPVTAVLGRALRGRVD